MRYLLILSLTAISFFISCSFSGEIEPFSDPSVEGPYIQFKGEMVYEEIEGGFWAIQSDDNKLYDPMNLPERFQEKGVEVNVKARVRNDMAGIHMRGTIIQIHSIEVIN